MSRVVEVAVRHPRVRVAAAPVVAVVHALDRMRSYRCPRGALSIAFLGDRETARVHADYLDDPTVTDVITFPGEDHPDEPFAGEICVNIDQARRAAKVVPCSLAARRAWSMFTQISPANGSSGWSSPGKVITSVTEGSSR